MSLADYRYAEALQAKYAKGGSHYREPVRTPSTAPRCRNCAHGIAGVCDCGCECHAKRLDLATLEAVRERVRERVLNRMRLDALQLQLGTWKDGPERAVLQGVLDDIDAMVRGCS